jgi:hypothetical protein
VRISRRVLKHIVVGGVTAVAASCGGTADDRASTRPLVDVASSAPRSNRPGTQNRTSLSPQRVVDPSHDDELNVSGYLFGLKDTALVCSGYFETNPLSCSQLVAAFDLQDVMRLAPPIEARLDLSHDRADYIPGPYPPLVNVALSPKYIDFVASQRPGSLLAHVPADLIAAIEVLPPDAQATDTRQEYRAVSVDEPRLIGPDELDRLYSDMDALNEQMQGRLAGEIRIEVVVDDPGTTEAWIGVTSQLPLTADDQNQIIDTAAGRVTSFSFKSSVTRGG